MKIWRFMALSSLFGNHNMDCSELQGLFNGLGQIKKAPQGASEGLSCKVSQPLIKP